MRRFLSLERRLRIISRIREQTRRNKLQLEREQPLVHLGFPLNVQGYIIWIPLFVCQIRPRSISFANLLVCTFLSVISQVIRPMDKPHSQQRSRRHQKISLQQLRHAVLAADTGSFRQAAQAALIKQSTLSRSVRQLEHLVGGSIFERSKSGVRATESGRNFLHVAKTVLEQMDTLALTARMDEQGYLGRISIGFYTSLSTGNLRSMLIEYARRFPTINISMLEGSRASLATALRSRVIDIAIITGDRPLTDSRSIPLWSERILVVLPKAHKLAAREALSWTDLGSETLLLGRRDPGPAIQELIAAKITSPEDRPRIVSQEISRESVKSLIGADFGIGLTLEASLGATFAGVVHKEVLDGAGLARISLSASWREDNENPALADLLELLRERYPSPSY